eukprot:CAMPEP_0194039212 /NCGR_PEP_ID=MMETSP0009_2-20130614/11361_1 /TAXON_ID=210454 /ORGANISM="Grammatophora oceanica, Strain CCMP 410" /LENGTH=210 /DNA_ID=CAMNT_0038681963 /DNA_START=182 /DNA_END=814 /DNA_ORIENTATION=-
MVRESVSFPLSRMQLLGQRNNPVRRQVSNEDEGWQEGGDQDASQQDPVEANVFRKGKKGKKKKFKPYEVLDNRDNLPFRVELQTPDPYTREEIKLKRAKENTKMDRKQKKPITTNLSAVYNLPDGASSSERDFLGEFYLDKSTQSGDIIQVADRLFVVQKTRCQYKYTGARKFTMVRKILEVKPLRRVSDEQILSRQLKATPDEGTLELE